MTSRAQSAGHQAAAYQANAQSVSAEVFYALACDPRRSIVVEACAGAGKTWMLVSRMLRALLEGAQPQDILAITFTRKAAGEMRARLNDWLAEFAAPACSAEKRIEALAQRGMSAQQALEFEPTLGALQERVLASGRAVEIRTFHAWFAQLLRAAPLDMLAELGLQADMALIESLDDHLSAVYRRFHAVVCKDEALRADFDAQVLLRGRSQLRKWLDTALHKRIEIELTDNAGRLDSSVPNAAAQWPELAELPHPRHRIQAPDVRSLMLSLAQALGAQTGAVPRKQGSLLEQAMKEGEADAAFAGAWAALFTQKNELRKKLDVPQLEAAAACLQRIQQACEQQAAHEEHLRMTRLARVLLVQFAAYKRARGLADMPDLERCALALLRDSNLAGWLQERLDSSIRHVLIDEFQDTSPLQWQALHAWLSGYAGAGGGGSGQRPPGVFIVGDPKQSIYRFRRAEPRVFAAAREFVVDGLQGQVLECDHTRRNLPQILTAVNAVFNQAQSDGEFQGFREHTTGASLAASAQTAGVFCLPRTERPLKAERSDSAADACVWRDSLTTPRHQPEEALRQQEARQVALAVHELVVQHGVLPGAIYILSRKRLSLRWAAQALAALQLPRAAAEATALLDSPAVRDLVAVLDVLASHTQNLALAQALRSPLFAASDADLIAIADAVSAGQKETSWWQALMSLRDVSAALQRAQGLLRSWSDAALALPPHDLLDRIVGEGEFRERTAAAVSAERRSAALNAIDALLGLSLSLNGARYATPYNFVRALKRGALKLPLPLQADAVQLLTVHGAKGLEADVVFVMDADPELQRAETAAVLVDWPIEAAAPRRCAFVYSESVARCPPSLQDVVAVEAAAREREELNSLYVAMTRARRCLVFSATQPYASHSAQSWWQRLQTLSTPWTPQPATAPSSGSAATHVFVLPALPVWNAPAKALNAPRLLIEPASDISRKGEAFHRAMEWATARNAVESAVQVQAWCAQAAREFQLGDAAAQDVFEVVQRVLTSPATQRFFSGDALAWAGNEVAVSASDEQGQRVLRIDRLVALRCAADGKSNGPQIETWWVLDYKLHSAPHSVPELCAQLLQYRNAVQCLQREALVRCAFISGAGELLEITPPPAS